MMHEIVKNKIDNSTEELIYTDTIEGKHFGVPIHKKNYPSCYQYNVLIMLAKRLIKEDADKFANRLHLDKKFAEKIFNSEKQENDLIS